MKVLFLTPQLPFPPFSGGVIKSYKLIEHLSVSNNVEMVCFLKQPRDKEYLSAFLKIMPKVNVLTDLIFPIDIPRTPINLTKSYFNSMPLTIYRNKLKKLKKQIAAHANDYDTIFVDHYLMFQYVPSSYKGRIIVHQHNAEYVAWDRYSKLSINPLKKTLLKIEALRIKKYEIAMCRAATSILASPNDIEALISAGGPKENFFETFHLGNEENLALPDIEYGQTSLDVLFIGTLTWEANIDGLLWFIKESWPTIKKQIPGVCLTIAGNLSTKLNKQLLKLEPAAKVLGFVEDLEPLYRSHRVFVAPIRFGSGQKVKVVNGLYRGIPIVTTPIGVEGLAVKNEEHLLIGEDSFEFANSVIRLLNDPIIWQKLSHQSRTHMSNNYTWDKALMNVTRSLSE